MARITNQLRIKYINCIVGVADYNKEKPIVLFLEPKGIFNEVHRKI